MCPKIPEFVDPRQNPVASKSIIPDLLEEIRRGDLSLRQRAGTKNSLGLVKSTFSTEIDVSRYDMPATEVFEKSKREFSHGYIRLKKPADFAIFVLTSDLSWMGYGAENGVDKRWV